MINVLQRLAELDAGNPNIANPLAAGQKRVMEADQVAQLPDLTDMGDLRALSGLKQVNECMPMGIAELGGMSSNRPPASFSINATAADGAEVSSMLSDILNLAGVHKVGQEHMPSVDSPQSAMVQPPAMGNAKDAMRSALDTMNGDEMGDEVGEPETISGMDDEAAEPMVGMDDMGMGVGGDDMGGIAQPEMGGSIGGGSPEMASMADEIRNMADRLSQIDSKDELPGVDGESDDEANESYDNTPADMTRHTSFDANSFAYNGNAGGVNKGITTQPTATMEEIESSLFKEYSNFVAESKKKVKSTNEVKEGLNHRPSGPKIEKKDVDRVCDVAHKLGIPLVHEDQGCVMDCMASYPKFHKHITGKYNECWEDFHQACCDHYSTKHGLGMKDEQAITGPGSMNGGDGSYGMFEAKEKTMSRAAKGNEKYGKAGMQALAKAGREGKSLEPIKAKYNKYDEGSSNTSLSKAAKTVKKGALHKQEGIPQDKKIGDAKLKSLKKSGTPLEKKRANFALNIQGKGKK